MRPEGHAPIRRGDIPMRGSLRSSSSSFFSIPKLLIPPIPNGDT